MAEMWTRSPIMQGNTEQHQLTLISQLCGSITPEVRAGGGSCRGVVRAGTGAKCSCSSPCPVCGLLRVPSIILPAAGGRVL